MRLFSKYSVSILDKDWKPIKSLVKVKYIPRQGELIYLDDNVYYRVINVVYYILDKQGIFIIVEKLESNTQGSN